MIAIAYKGDEEPVKIGPDSSETEAAAADRSESPLAETTAKAEEEAAGDAPKKRTRKKK